MTNDILIRTYDKDAEWLYYCLATLDRYAFGFRKTVVICPPPSSPAIRPIAEDFGCEFKECPHLNHDDYVGQMGTKMHYDEYTDAEIITHVDADMIFSKPYTSMHLINDKGQVMIGKQRYSELVIPWKPITERLVGFGLEWEYNRVYPSAYPRWLYAATRARIAQVAGKPFLTVIYEVVRREFSEINVLGAVAEKYFPDRFEFMDITRDPLPSRPCSCYWSWGGITPEIKKRIDAAMNC